MSTTNIDIKEQVCEEQETQYMRFSAFQAMFFSDSISDKSKNSIIDSIFDWILFQRQLYRQKDQPSVAKAINLKNHLI